MRGLIKFVSVNYVCASSHVFAISVDSDNIGRRFCVAMQEVFFQFDSDVGCSAIVSTHCMV